MIEPLESRIAPASLTFTDVDGDKVVIKTTGPGTLTLGGNVTVTNGQLTKLDLTDAAFQNAGVSIVATRDPVAGGDGRVNVGFIDATGIDLGAVVVDGDLGQLVAGSGGDPKLGLASLKVASLGRMGITTGASALNVFVTGRLGALKVAGDVDDTYIVANTLGSARIGGSLIGIAYNGRLAVDGDMGRVKIGGDLVGGALDGIGVIRGHGAIAGVTIGGSIYGGSNPGINNPDLVSGAIIADGKLGRVKIGGSVHGGSGQHSGAIEGQAIAALTIGGSLIGGSANFSGAIQSSAALGPVKIGGSVVGGSIFFTGGLSAASFATVTIGGSILGGTGARSGFLDSSGAMGAVKIGGDINAGTGIVNVSTAFVFAKTSLASLTLGGSLLGSDDPDAGRIESDGPIGAVRIGGDIVGGNSDTMNIQISHTGCILGQHIGSVFVGGSIISGFQTNGGKLNSSGAIRADNDLGTIVIKGSLIGNETLPVFITAQQAAPGTVSFVALKSLTVGGRVEHAQIVAGVTSDVAMTPTNADAQIGAISVKGDWIASRATAGTKPGADKIYGTDDDSFIGGGIGNVVSKIARLAIKGQVFGSFNAAESFRFMAQKIGSFKAGGTAFPLIAGADNLVVSTTPSGVSIFDSF